MNGFAHEALLHEMPTPSVGYIERMYGYKVQINVRFILPCEIFSQKSSSGGVWIFNGVAHVTLILIFF